MKKMMSKIGAGLVAGSMFLLTCGVVGAVDVSQDQVDKANEAANKTSGTAATNLGFLQPAEIGGNLHYTKLIPQILNVIFVVAIAMVFFYLVFGAISWITSGGDKGKVEAARNKITAAVIGMLILASCWAVFTLLLQIFFGGGPETINLPDFST